MSHRRKPPGGQAAPAQKSGAPSVPLPPAELSVFLLGKGLIGRTLLAQLDRQRDDLHLHHGVLIRLVGLAGREGAVFAPGGIEPAEAAASLEKKHAGPLARQTPAALLAELALLPRPVLVDCTAADGMEALYAQAFANGIAVVSANKKPLALPQSAYDALKAEERRRRGAFHYETTVGAALPIIETLKNLVRTGDTVVRIEGAFSGTLGYLCDRLAAGDPLSSAVRQARELGYTEPHPRDDLSGMDVARKALILARELGLRLDLSDIALEPFVPPAVLKDDDPQGFISSLGKLDSEFAERVGGLRRRGSFLRYLARIEPLAAGAKVTVSPTEVRPDHPAASLRGAEAFAAFHTRRYRDYPLVIRGAGAGDDITASGVLADILRVAETAVGPGRFT